MNIILLNRCFPTGRGFVKRVYRYSLRCNGSMEFGFQCYYVRIYVALYLITSTVYLCIILSRIVSSQNFVWTV